MTRKILSTLLSAIIVGSAMTADAKPAKRGIRTITQPDGTELKVQLTGDEHFHYYTTADGYLLLEKGDRFYYGTVDADGKVVCSDRKAADAEHRTAADKAFLGKIDSKATIERFVAQRRQAVASGTAPAHAQGPGLFPGTSFPPMGEQKGLVVLVQYTDVAFRVSNPLDLFTRQLNEPGYSDYGATGSARDWFIKNSTGAFQPDFDVYGPITLAHNMSYYGGNDWWGNDQHPEEMVIEACQQLDGVIDFTQYDRDGDGSIDNVYVFYAGQGEADGGSANTVWPHSWDLSSAQPYNTYMFDGVRLDRYACSNEWDGNSSGGRPDGIGTFCHEFSHVMGLPDLYATSYTGAFTPGAWDAMDYGNYNNDGRTPPTYSAFERYALGWIDPIVIDRRLNGSLTHIENSNQAYIINTDDPNEYFMLENRQQEGWDAHIPGHGMLIWHIDYDDDVWTNNKVNNSTSHQYVDIEEADNTSGDYSRDGDAFPGTAHVTSFTADTRPAMKTWAGVGLNYPITEITESDGIITFRVLGGIIHVDPTTLSDEAADVTCDAFTASWTAVSNATNYRATLRYKADDGRYVAVAGYNNYDVGQVTSYTFGGLTPETTYYLTIVAENNGSFSVPSNEIAVTTARPRFEDSRVELAEATDVADNAFTINWAEHPDATEYYVNVYDKLVENRNTDICNFDGGLSNMPEGWSTDSHSTYGNTTNSGQAAPAVKLAENGSYVETPLYDADIAELSFWARGVSSSENNSITVRALVDGNWAPVANYALTSGRVNTIDELPYGTRRLRIEYNKVGAGYLAVDDIEVLWGGEVTITPVGEYTDYNAGSATSFRVTGLEPLTRYFYTVHAGNGEALSMKSREGTVMTAETSAIKTVNPDSGITITPAGRAVIVTSAPGTRVTVSDPAGRIVASRTASDLVTRLSLPASGIYIVRAADKVAKVVVK